MEGESRERSQGTPPPDEVDVWSKTIAAAGLAWLTWSVGTGAFHLVDPGHLLGFDEDVVDGTGFAWLSELCPDQGEAFVRALRPASEGETSIDLECRLAGKAIEIRGAVLRDGSGERLGSAFLRDVSLERASADELRAKEARFRQVFENAPVGIVLTDDTDVLLDVNGAFESLSGYRRDEVVGSGAERFGFWSSTEDKAKVRRHLEGKREGLLDLNLRTKAGRVREILASITPGPVDGVGGLVKVLLDVTERNYSRRRLMEALRAAMKDTTWLAESFLEKLGELEGDSDSGDLSVLTERERQVLTLLAEGTNTEEVARKLAITASTVRNYISTIYGKLGLSSRAEAIVWARQHGLGGE